MLSFHEIQAEIGRQEAKLERQQKAVEQTAKLIAGLRELQEQGSKKKG